MLPTLQGSHDPAGKTEDDSQEDSVKQLAQPNDILVTDKASGASYQSHSSSESNPANQDAATTVHDSVATKTSGSEPESEAPAAVAEGVLC